MNSEEKAEQIERVCRMFLNKNGKVKTPVPYLDIECECIKNNLVYSNICGILGI